MHRVHATRRHALAALAAFVSTVGLTAAWRAPAAHAEGPGPRLELGAGIGLGTSATLGDVTGVTPEISLTIPVTKHGSVVADWGLTYVSGKAAPPTKSSGLALQDPFIGLELVVDDDDLRMTFRPG